MMLDWFERRFGPAIAVIRDRFRASFLRLRGAKIAARARIGARVVVQRPWCLVVGVRSHIEHQVHIKATSDSARISLGQNVFVGFNSEFDISEGLSIGNDVLIAPGCFITDHNHRHAAAQLLSSQGCESRPVTIEDDVWLGAHVVVLPGVTISRGAIVAAGAVVNRDVASMDMVGGVPARVIGRRE